MLTFLFFCVIISLYSPMWSNIMSTKKVHGNTGRVATEEAKAAMKAGWEQWHEDGKTKKPFTKTHRRRLSESQQGDNNNMAGKNHSVESKEKMREKATGRKQDAKTIKKKAEASRGTKRGKVHCKWCNEDVAVNGYARFHGDNCHKNPLSLRYDPNKKIRKPKA